MLVCHSLLGGSAPAVLLAALFAIEPLRAQDSSQASRPAYHALR